MSRSAFVERVAQVVRSIPKGTTLSYAQVALRCGVPGAMRAVVRALHQLADEPWWRVVRSDGTLAPAVAARQARLLRREGVRVVGRRLVRGQPSPTAKRRTSGALRSNARRT